MTLCLCPSEFEWVVNAVNIVITIAFLVYCVRAYGLFRGGTIGRSIRILIGSAWFTVLAVLVRAGLIWNLLPVDFASVELILRSFGFVLLFAFVWYLLRGSNRSLEGRS